MFAELHRRLDLVEVGIARLRQVRAERARLIEEDQKIQAAQLRELIEQRRKELNADQS